MKLLHPWNKAIFVVVNVLYQCFVYKVFSCGSRLLRSGCGRFNTIDVSLRITWRMGSIPRRLAVVRKRFRPEGDLRSIDVDGVRKRFRRCCWDVLGRDRVNFELRTWWVQCPNKSSGRHQDSQPKINDDHFCFAVKEATKELALVAVLYISKWSLAEPPRDGLLAQNQRLEGDVSRCLGTCQLLPEAPAQTSAKDFKWLVCYIDMDFRHMSIPKSEIPRV